MYYYFIKRAICALAFSLCCLAAAAQTGLSLTTVLIDAGHGGKDPGAVSRDRKTYEKTLTLDISRRLASKIRKAYPEVKVVLSRDSDTFVSLDGRATRANNVNANLFISIHINAATNTSANGYSVHVLGQSSVKDRDLFEYNMNVCQRENSVIMLEEDYSTKYSGFDPTDPESFIFAQLMQNAFLEQSLRFAQDISDNLKGGPIRNGRGIWQDPFYVLWKTSMPAVLVELGFISNGEDLSRLRNENDRDDIAERLFKAFATYKANYDRSMTLDVPAEPVKPAEPAVVEKPAEPVKAEEPAKPDEPAVVEKPAEPAEPEKAAAGSAAPDKPAVLYGTQVFATAKLFDKDDPRFLGYEPVIVRFGNLYRYILGVSENEDEAREIYRTIKTKYPTSYTVKVVGEEVTRY